MKKWPTITGFRAIDDDFKRIVDLACRLPCIRAEVFEISVEPGKTTSLDLSHLAPPIFRFEDGHCIAYFRSKHMGGKDNGPPYPNRVWVDENYRHLLIEYQI